MIRDKRTRAAEREIKSITRRLEQTLRAMDRLSGEMTQSGLTGYARRLRGMRTTIASFPGFPNYERVAFK
jgi:hypothetical protein